MIKISRDGVATPAVLAREDDGRARGGAVSGQKEARKARESLEAWIAAGKDPAQWRFGFSVYKHEDVKDALTRLFHGKCAYCETRYAVTQPMDVEHWRPKGQVQLADGTPQKPAYFWLAASWKNLLPSCIDCNRKRRQIDAVTGDEVSSGKLDQFPVANEASRAHEVDAEANEEPLLLNPCEDEPAEFLEYVEEAVVAPRAAAGLERDKARESIRVYGLNRSMLVLSRQEHLELIRLRIATIKGLAGVLVDNPTLAPSVVTVIEDLMLAEIRQLARARREDSEYALLARQTITEHMSEFAALNVELDPPG